MRHLNRYLLLLTLGLALISLFAGSRAFSLLSIFWGQDQHNSATILLILQQIRLPRVLIGLVVGAVLGLAGAILQGLLRNPLAEPGLIGASSSAALGAVIVLYFGLAGLAPWLLPVGGMLGALLGVLLVVGLAGGGHGGLGLILAGVAVNSLSAALTSLALNLAPSPYAALEIVFWLLGSLADRSFEHLWLALPGVLVGLSLVLGCGRGLDALCLGEETARSLGIHLAWLRLRCVLGLGLAIGACVAVSGSIGFIGLVVPHLLRPVTGYQPSRLLLPSALGGAALLTAADLLVRLLPGHGELKLGVITALLGTPLFLHLLWQYRQRGTGYELA